MKLLEFRVQNYRSINDSGIIRASKRTALVGRNESGKTNLLLALHSLNSPAGLLDLSYIKDFPRDRAQSEFSEDLEVVNTVWELAEEETKALTDILPRAQSVKRVSISRTYEKTRYVRLCDLLPLSQNAEQHKPLLAKVKSSCNGALHSVDATVAEAVSQSLVTLESTIAAESSSEKDWANSVKPAVAAFRKQTSARSFSIPEMAAASLAGLEKLAEDILSDEAAQSKAREWVVKAMPLFIYVTDFPELEGHQSISQYITRKSNNSRTEADRNFEKLLKVSGLDAQQLQNMLGSNHEMRQQLANRAGAVITKRIRELWTDRNLKIRFNLDAEHFDTLVSDPAATYDVEINLNERSRGFKWFFSFYITFAADTMGGTADNAVLLLDEPGLYLHAVAQKNFTDHLLHGFKNQILFTTHSPFMIPVDDLASVRTINISAEAGTTATNDPTGDSKTLFPLQTALGYDLTQTLFVGEKGIVVEGVSDYWYLSTASDYLNSTAGAGLPKKLVLTPAGGAQKVCYMVALLSSQRLKIMVLLDSEPAAATTGKQLISEKLIREQNVLFVHEAFVQGLKPQTEMDLEDVLEPSVFDALVKEAYSDELKGKSLALNAQIPRIVKRYENAFRGLGLELNKMRVAKLFLRKIAEKPETVMTPETTLRFKNLFSLISSRVNQHLNHDREPFR